MWPSARESSGENKFDLIFTNYFPSRVLNIFAFKIFSSAAAEREDNGSFRQDAALLLLLQCAPGLTSVFCFNKMSQFTTSIIWAS